MAPLLGRPLSAILFAPEDDAERMAAAENELRATAITQPAVLTVDVALTRLLAAYGLEPDFVMGHSLGEYGALVAAGSLSFAQALEAVSARGREMTRLSVGDPGKMLAVFGPLAEIEKALGEVDGYVVVANINSNTQAVIGGDSEAVDQAAVLLSARGFDCRFLPVSHAFHTRLVAPAGEPLKAMLARLDLRPPRLPVVSNATGDFYPRGDDVVPEMMDLLARQIAEPVQFVKGLETLYAAGARVFVEIGPKRALQGFVADVLGHRKDVLSLSTNHPKAGDVASINHALCGLYAAGRGTPAAAAPAPAVVQAPAPAPSAPFAAAAATAPLAAPAAPADPATVERLGLLFADFLSRGFEIYRQRGRPASGTHARPSRAWSSPAPRSGLPGSERVFDDGQLAHLLAGRQRIGLDPGRAASRDGRQAHPAAGQERRRRRALRVDRVARRGDPARGARWRASTSPATSACPPTASPPATARRCSPWAPASTRCATPDCRWSCATRPPPPAAAPARPLGSARRSARLDRRGLRLRLPRLRPADRTGRGVPRRPRAPTRALVELRGAARPRRRRARCADLDRRIVALESAIERDAYAFDRRFLFQVLAMGHAQFAEAIGARGPNIQINSACASTTQAFAVASDWIRTGRCARVVVIAADDITSDTMLPWFGAGFVASGAAATDARVEDAALPFDRRRHGLLIGMGAAAAVLESADSARTRGLAPICEVLGTVSANSAFHGSRLDVAHIGQVMEQLVADAERALGDRSPRDRAGAGLRLSRDLHPGARRQRAGRGRRAAARLRRRRRADRGGQHQGLHRPPDGRRHRGRPGDQVARDRPRPAGAEPARGRPRARRAPPLARRRLPDPLRAAPRRRLRLADQHDAAALGGDRRRPPPARRRARLRVPDRRPRRLDGVARARRRCARRPPRGR